MRKTLPLSDADCRALKPSFSGGTPPRIFDGDGLYLEALPSGKKIWRLKYRRPAGGETRATFGEYPAVTLQAARRKRTEAKRLLADGLDPNEVVAREREASKAVTEGTFAAVTERWKVDELSANAPETIKRTAQMLDRDVLPYLGARPLSGVKTRELITVFDRIRERGVEETSRRARMVVGQIFRYAIRRGLTENDPTQALKGERRLQPVKHFSAFTEPADVAKLVRAMWDYKGTPEVRAALKLSALLFQRPGEIRAMEWSQIDFNAREWRYVVNKTRRTTGQSHIVPLCDEAIAVLRELQPLTDKPLVSRPDAPRYVFPGQRSRLRPMSENTVRGALRNMGYSNDDMTAHGFRAMARSLLAERGWPVDAIERQLSHKPAGPLGAAYDRAAFLETRREMMTWWAGFLQALRDGRDVSGLRRAA